MPELPVGTVTFLFTDVEGSTRLWEASPSETRAALARDDRLVQEHVAAHNGALLKARGEGDSHFAAFARATDALAASCSLQRALLAEPFPVPLKVRVALHTGEAELRDGDYYGAAVNRCARLRAIAHGGQVLLSTVTEELVRDALPQNASLKDLGEQRLRDLTRSERVYQLCHPDLPADFPPLRTLDAYPNNLPLQLTSFVGRERETGEVRQLLGQTRLLTITGTGGCGKTRLAYQVAADLLEEYPDGVWAVELAALSDPELVTQAVASALGLREQPGQPILETLVGHLKPRRLLVVLDNCEHLLDASARLADSILRACPSVRVLATSREGLGIGGETSYRVPSLSLPELRSPTSASSRQPSPPSRSIGELRESEAVRLFVERANAAQSGFELTEQNAAAVARVCWRLDGFPLALELAAARVRGLTVDQLATRLDDRFKLLTGGSRTAFRRQQTLRATIDWSHDLLSEPERVLLRRLAVFAGGFSLEAAELVCSGGEVDSAEVIDLLLHLVDRSLVLAEGQGVDGRYRLLETIRQYAQEKLFESGETAAVRDRHLEWCLALAKRGKLELMIWGRERPAWLEQLEREQDNFRAALNWSLARDEEAGTAVSLGAALGYLWSMGGSVTEMREQLGSVLARPGGEPEARCAILSWAAHAESFAGDWRKAREWREEALALARETEDKRLIASMLVGLSFTDFDLGDYADSSALLEEALGLSREVGDRQDIAQILSLLARLLYLMGDDSAARRLAEEGLELCRELGDSGEIAAGLLVTFSHIALGEVDLSRARSLAEAGLAQAEEAGSTVMRSFCLGCLGDVARAEGEYAEAEGLYRDSLAVFQPLTVRGDWLRTTGPLIRFAGIWVARGRTREAALLYGATHGWLESMGLRVPHTSPRGYLRDEEATRTALGEEAFARAFAEGQAMTLEQAVDYALRDEPQSGN